MPMIFIKDSLLGEFSVSQKDGEIWRRWRDGRMKQPQGQRNV